MTIVFSTSSVIIIDIGRIIDNGGNHGIDIINAYSCFSISVIIISIIISYISFDSCSSGSISRSSSSAAISSLVGSSNMRSSLRNSSGSNNVCISCSLINEITNSGNGIDSISSGRSSSIANSISYSIIRFFIFASGCVRSIINSVSEAGVLRKDQ